MTAMSDLSAQVHAVLDAAEDAISKHLAVYVRGGVRSGVTPLHQALAAIDAVRAAQAAPMEGELEQVLRHLAHPAVRVGYEARSHYRARARLVTVRRALARVGLRVARLARWSADLRAAHRLTRACDGTLCHAYVEIVTLLLEEERRREPA